MTTEKYNGWTNYETWNCKLWIDNSQGDQEYWVEQAQDAYDSAEKDDSFTKKENAALDLMDRLKDSFEENVPTDVSGFYADIMNAALSEVNWHEIAESLLEDVEEEATTEA
jgi:hypothetical protein